jgi:N-acetylglucosaminyl-diphospho-decaprenol L-rhamnosyltransferase
MSLILCVSYSGAFGGAERVLIQFASGLSTGRAPTEVSVACPEGPLASAARTADLRVFPLPQRSLEVRGTGRDRLLGPVRLADHARELRRLSSDLDPDLVIAWGMRTAIASLGVAADRGLVVAHHDLVPGRLIGAAVRRAAGRAGVVVVPSSFVAHDLDPRERLRGRLRVVHPGVELVPDGPAAAPPVVVVVGSLVGWKRPELALEALALARRDHPELRLWLVGEATGSRSEELLSGLRARASGPDLAGAVEFVGQVGDVRPWLQRSSCLLHCADREPFGLAVLEAMAAGRPVVVPAAGGPAEIADRSCAFLYPPGDAPAAAAALVKLSGDGELAGRLGARGRERARAQFGARAAAARFAGTVAPVVRRRPRAAVAPGSLAVVTVTHNSARELRGLLGSVARHLPGTRVVVVDCASGDETRAVAAADESTVLIALNENVGFGRACNLGLRSVGEPAAALVNPDVEVIDDSVLRLVAEAWRPNTPERLLAPLVLNPDGTRQDTVHARPGSPSSLLHALISPAVLPGTLVAPWRAVSPRRVGWAVGCALVGRTATLRRLGPFDERIFLYGEDLDLGLRAAMVGIETWFWPSARVVHHRAHASQAEFGGEPFELLAAARHDVIARRLGRRRVALDDATQALTFSSRLALKRTLGRSAARERHQLGALARVRSGNL